MCDAARANPDDLRCFFFSCTHSLTRNTRHGQIEYLVGCGGRAFSNSFATETRGCSPEVFARCRPSAVFPSVRPSVP